MGKQFYIGLVCGFILVGCAGVSFPYKYYDPQFINYDGSLLGATPKDDLPGSSCAPTANNPHPCVVMFTQTFFSMKLEFEDMQNRLNSTPPKP
jgi:hypothetical protein